MLRNQTTIEKFWLRGFENVHNCKVVLFVIFLIIYTFTLFANVVIILLVATSSFISSPMFFFLGNLSSCDLMLTTTVTPEMLTVLLRDGGAITLRRCFTQFVFLSISLGAECLLLTVMSYDRYLAVCDPLRYSSIMDFKLCVLLVVPSWGLGILASSPHVVFLNRLSFCGSNVVNHFFCDLPPVLRLSCSDTTMYHLIITAMSVPVVFLPFVFISITYIHIVLAILRISTTTGRQKAFSTCSSHLTVVCLFYGTLVFNYLVPSETEYSGFKNLVSVLYTVVTPLLNPVLYGLRNGQIRDALITFILKRNKNKTSQIASIVSVEVNIRLSNEHSRK